MRSQSAFFLMMALGGLAVAATATTTTTTTNTSSLDLPTVQCVDLETNTVVKEGAVEQKVEGNEVVLFDRTPQGPGGSSAKVEVAAATAAAVTTTQTVVTETKAPAKKARQKTAIRKTVSITPAGSGVTDIVPASDSTVRIVPVARPGYISGVTATGETVMIPIGTTRSQTVTTFEKDLKTELRVTGRSFINSQGKAVVVVPVAKPGYISGVTAAGDIVLIPTGATAKTEVTSAALVASAAPVAASTTTTTTTTVVKSPASAEPAAEAKLEQEVAAEETTTATTSTSAQSTSTTHVTKYTTVPSKVAYAQIVAGLGGYPEVNNVNSGYDITGAVGYYYNNYMFEVGGGIAKYSMDVRNYSFFNKIDNFDIDQYRGHLAAKYRFDKGAMGLSHRFQPIVGTLLTYTQRQYNLTNPAVATNSNNTGSSTAVDAGLNAGLDYEFNEDYAVGFDFKYMFNLSNEVNANYANPNAGYNGTPIERLQYYIAGISAKMNF